MGAQAPFVEPEAVDQIEIRARRQHDIADDVRQPLRRTGARRQEQVVLGAVALPDQHAVIAGALIIEAEP